MLQYVNKVLAVKDALASLRLGRLGGNQAAPPPVHSTLALADWCRCSRRRWQPAVAVDPSRLLRYLPLVPPLLSPSPPHPALLSPSPSSASSGAPARLRPDPGSSPLDLWSPAMDPVVPAWDPFDDALRLPAWRATMVRCWLGTCAWLARLNAGASWRVACAASGGGSGGIIVPLASPRRRCPPIAAA
jgi:hypothetical protein